MAFLVDTNVIVRWLLPHDPLSPPAVTAIDTLRGRGETVYGSAQNLIELWNVATRPPTANGLGMTPARYRSKGAGLGIAFTTFGSPLGAVLVAATGRGVCCVSLGANAHALEAALRAEFSAAVIARDDRGLRDYTRRIARYLAGSQRDLDLPLDIRATAFQRKVWNLLRAIPYGTTRSYSDIARQAGKPSAVRAVARAIATNPVALVIPCHRAIGSSGSLTGYRWGIQRKRRLLDSERSHGKTASATGG